MRNDNLHRLKALLRTDEGELLMEDLRAQLNPTEFDADNPTRLAYQAGKRDAYEYLLAIHRGDMTDE